MQRSKNKTRTTKPSLHMKQTLQCPSQPSSSSPSSPASSGPSAVGEEAVTADRRTEQSVLVKWRIASFSKAKAKVLYSPHFEVAGYDCRLVIHPRGDAVALPGYASLFIEITDPLRSKWDCFAYYKLHIIDHHDISKSECKESCHRFSVKKMSHGWSDFMLSSTILDSVLGFLSNDSLLIAADIRILKEFLSITGNSSELSSGSNVYCGKVAWTILNFNLFREMIKKQKITSPVFQAGKFNLRVVVYRSVVNGVEYLSLCLESKETQQILFIPGASFWCLFKISVLSQKPGVNHTHRESYGRFGVDGKSGDNKSLGWIDYMKMSEFVGLDNGYLVDGKVEIGVSYNVIKEFCNFSRGFLAGSGAGGPRKYDGYSGKITWKIENFTKLKDLLKKRKIRNLCVKSARIRIGNRDCRLVVYPRGQSEPPCHLSLFLEVTDSQITSCDWSSFVYYRLSLVNQRTEDKSVTKESQNRYSKDSKDSGWREFVTLTSLFDQDSGFVVRDTVVLSAEILILKETFLMQDSLMLRTAGLPIDTDMKTWSLLWTVENFLSFKEIMEAQKIFCKFFQIDGCQLRMGFCKSLDTLCACLECDPSVVNDPDENFWVSYRMALVNQKNPAKSLWEESSFCTRTGNNSFVEFMKVSDMLEPDAGFLVRQTVVFISTILDCCPWFEFSGLEVLASGDEQDALLTDHGELINSEDLEVISPDVEAILARAGFCLKDDSLQPQVTRREFLADASVIAGFLNELNVYLDVPIGGKHFLPLTKLNGSNDEKQPATRADGSSIRLTDIRLGLKVLREAFAYTLLDIMVDCCQPSGGRFSGDSNDARTKCSSNSNEAMIKSECDQENEAAGFVQSPIFKTLGSKMNECIRSCTGKCLHMNTADLPKEAITGLTISSPEATADGPVHFSCIQALKIKRSEQSEELFSLIVDYLKAQVSTVPQGCAELRQRPQSAQKMSVILDKAPRHLQPDLVTLVPILVDHSEHPAAACALLDLLQKPDAGPALQPHVLSALCVLDFGGEVSERVLSQASDLLVNSNDESLAATIGFLFKAASQCQRIPEAVRIVQVSLRHLGADISPSVLDFLSKTVNDCSDVATSMLREIDSAFGLDDKCSKNCSGPLWYGENEPLTKSLNLVDEQHLRAHCHFFDVYILIEMLSIPSLTVEASQVFESAVAQGSIDNHLTVIVLQRRLAQRVTVDSTFVSEKYRHKDIMVEGKIESLPVEEFNFTVVLGLAEKLILSRDSEVHRFGMMLCAMLFKLFPGEGYQRRMLNLLVDHVTGLKENCCEIDIVWDALISFHEEQGAAKIVLGMMKEVVEHASVDDAALQHQLRYKEDENFCIKVERLAELSNMVTERAIWLKRLSESEAAINHFKSEMKSEMDHFASEKKELSEQILEVESQLEWLHSEQDAEIAKLSKEKKFYKERLHDVERQLSLLKSQRCDELKKLVKEKDALSGRLKSAEAKRKRTDDELKHYAANNLILEETRKSLEVEVRQLKQTVGQIEGERREKEGQVMKCEAYIYELEAKLDACQQYIHSLELALREEMLQHAPLYGAGLEALSMQELETLWHIHEEGLRQIHALRQQNFVIGGNPS